MIRIETPALRMPRKMARNSAHSCSSRPEKGSSINTTDAPMASTRPMSATFCTPNGNSVGNESA